MDDIVSKMPTWLIISAIIIILIAVVIILYRIMRGSGVIIEGKDGRKFSLISGLPGSKPTFGCSDSQLAKLEALERKLSTIYDSMKLAILVYMAHDLEVPENMLSNNDDLIFIRALLWQITYGKNGKRSIRTIVEDYIIRGEFDIPDNMHPTDKIKTRQNVMRKIVPEITSEMMMLFDDKYDNSITHFSRETKESVEQKRAIAQEQITKLMREHINTDVSPIIETIFDEE